MADREDIYWDTCLFMEWFGDEESTPDRVAKLRGIMREVEEGKRRIVTSLITQLEVIPDYIDAKKRGASEQFMSAFDGTRMIGVEVSPNIIALAREIRSHYYVAPEEAEYEETGGERRLVKEEVVERKMDMGDCIHVATAITYSIPTLHTRDGAGRRRRRHNFPILEIQEKDSGKVCGRYDLEISEPDTLTPDMLDALLDGGSDDEE